MDLNHFLYYPEDGGQIGSTLRVDISRFLSFVDLVMEKF